MLCLPQHRWLRTYPCRSSTQGLISHSSTESEIIALDEAVRELQFLLPLLADFGYKIAVPVTIAHDNLSAIQLTQASHYNPRTKHIAIRFMYINQLIREGVVKVIHQSSVQMPSDALTKPLDIEAHRRHCGVLLGYRALEWTSQ